MNPWTGYWDNKSERMNMRLYEDNGRDSGTGKGISRKVWRFLRNEFWKNIGCLISAPTFSIGGKGYGRRGMNKR